MSPWTVATRLLCPWDFPGKNTGVGCHALLQMIFQTQGSNKHLLPCRWLLYCWATRKAYVRVQFSRSVMSDSATPWNAACEASLYITNSWSILKLMPIELVMLFNHLILCHPLLLPPSIFPSIRVFSNELVLCIRWPKDWSFSLTMSTSNEYSGLISFRMNWLISLQFKGLSRVFSNTTVQKHQFFGAQLSL